MKKLLVFTDLDGSLLDHHDYSWQAAIPALDALMQDEHPLIINSSKTAAEIQDLNQQLKNIHPFISENGAVANIPCNYFNKEGRHRATQQYDAHHFASSYEQVTQTLDELRQKYGFCFRGFHDLTVDEVMAETGLEKRQAEAAKQRQASEPLRWLDSEKQLEQFRSLLKIKGLILTSGGRYLHVMSDVNKGQGVAWLLQQYQRSQPRVDWITVGLGDSLNDVAMLEAVEYSVLIVNPAGKRPDVSHLKNIYRPQQPGPAGWNEAILYLLARVV